MEFLARHFERCDDGSVILVDSHTGDVIEMDDIDRKFVNVCEDNGSFSWYDDE